MNQTEKAHAFRALHQRAAAFVIPNPWDVGSARILAHLGFEAIATTSAGFALSTGRPDGAVGRDDMIAHIADLAAATDLPLSADLENGYGDSPESAAEAIRLAAQAGAVGASIEDSTGDPARPIYDLAHAADRIRAAAEAARSLPFPFTLTARAENYLHDRPDLKDTIARLHAYQQAGADVLYAPGLTTREQITTVIAAINRPINVLIGLPGTAFTVADLSALGVRRLSTGSALYRAAITAFLKAAQEMQAKGTFTIAAESANSSTLAAMF